jgi:hypothetical protein
MERVVKALGHTREGHDDSGDHWTPVLKTDMAVATLYPGCSHTSATA